MRNKKRVAVSSPGRTVRIKSRWSGQEMELEEGKEYIFLFKEKEGANNKIKKVKKKLKLLHCYQNHAYFQTEHGYCRSYDYFTLEKLLKGEAIE